MIPKTGVNRIYWGMDKKGFRWPNQPKPRPGSPERGGGGLVYPGTYKVKFTYNKIIDSTLLEVKADPRIEFSVEALKKNEASLEKLILKIDLLAQAYDRVKESKETIASVKKMTPKKKDESTKKLREATKAVEEAMKVMTENMYSEENIQGIYRNPEIITSKIRSIRSAVYSFEEFNPTQLLILKQAEETIDKTLEKVNTFYEQDWVKFQNVVEESNLSLFKNYKPLK